MEAVTRSQYKRSFHKFEEELITVTGHGPPRAHAHFVLWVGLVLPTRTSRGGPSSRPCAGLGLERGLLLLSRKPPSLSLPQTVTQ